MPDQALLAAAPDLLAECKRQREEISELTRAAVESLRRNDARADAERCSQREEIAKLRAALQNAVAEGYREQWAHPGIGRHDPYLIAAPAWVDKARAALARTEDA